MQREKTIGKAFCYICVLFPIMFIYSAGIAGLTLADVALIIWIVCVLVNSISTKVIQISNIQRPALMLCIYIFIIAIAEYAWGYSGTVILKVIRYLIYFMSISLFSFQYLDFNYFVGLYKKVAIISSALLVFQTISWNLFGIKIPGILPFLQTTSDEFFNVKQFAATIIGTYRPCSFFAEPAHFASFVVGCLAIYLYQDELKWAALISIAILLSSSGTGIICMGIEWIFWLATHYFPKANLRKTLFIIGLFIAGIIIFITSSQVQLFISRTITTDSAVTGRLGVYSIFGQLTSTLSTPNKLFGIGMIDMSIYSTYLPGIVQFVLDFGYIGTLLLGNLIIKAITILKKERRIVFFTLILLSIGTMSLMSYLILLYFGIAFSGGEEGEGAITQSNI